MAQQGPTRRNLVGTVADRLRGMVFASQPDSLIGSLPDLARTIGVGIVTLQQAARVLEHEGLLEVRRGPGGGYYGRRPDLAAVERSIAAYIRANPTSFDEALNITSLLFIELVGAAAGNANDQARGDLVRLSQRVHECWTNEDCGAFEAEFQEVLFQMVDWPLIKLLTIVTLHLGRTNATRLLRSGDGAIVEWRTGRERIITAILNGDSELARFEADRSNRRSVLSTIATHKGAGIGAGP